MPIDPAKSNAISKGFRSNNVVSQIAKLFGLSDTEPVKQYSEPNPKDKYIDAVINSKFNTPVDWDTSDAQTTMTPEQQAKYKQQMLDINVDSATRSNFYKQKKEMLEEMRREAFKRMK